MVYVNKADVQQAETNKENVRNLERKVALLTDEKRKMVFAHVEEKRMVSVLEDEKEKMNKVHDEEKRVLHDQQVLFSLIERLCVGK